MLTEAADLAIWVMLQGTGVHEIMFHDSEWLAETLRSQRNSSSFLTPCAHTEPELVFTGKRTFVSRHIESPNVCLLEVTRSSPFSLSKKIPNLERASYSCVATLCGFKS